MADSLSEEGWLKELGAALTRQHSAAHQFIRYYEGEHKLAFATPKFREAFGNLLKEMADNWCQVVVDASVERLKVEGFRFGAPEADEDAWRIWQANGLDADANLAHREAVKCGIAYALVEPAADGGIPRITVEHPCEMIVAFAPGDRRQRLAALKRWKAEDGHRLATLYLPDRVLKFRSKGTDGRRLAWEPRPGDVPAEEPNPLGVVPVVPLFNSPQMLGGGLSDLAPVLPLQDAVNKLLTDVIVNSEYVAYPQRILTGVEVETDAEGNPLPSEERRAAASRLWAFPQPDAKVSQLTESDFTGHRSLIEMIVNHIAAQTRTPPHYLIGQIVNASGDALKAAETGLVAKVMDKQLAFGEGWEEVMRLAFLATGDMEKASAIDAEVIWKDPEHRTEGERVDALVKMAALGVPREVLWQKWGASPQEIARWKDMEPAPAVMAPPAR